MRRRFRLEQCEHYPWRSVREMEGRHRLLLSVCHLLARLGHRGTHLGPRSRDSGLPPPHLAQPILRLKTCVQNLHYARGRSPIDVTTVIILMSLE